MAPSPPPLPDDAAADAPAAADMPSGATIDLGRLDLDEEARPRKRGGRLGWLLAALFAVGCAALAGRMLDERAGARRDLGAARDEAADLRREMMKTQEKLAAAQKLADQAAAERAELEKQLAARSTASDDQQKLIAALRSQLDAKDGDVSQDQNRISVSLVDEILFKSGDAHLSPRGEKVLGRVGGVLKGLTDKQILIGGHTDTVPIHTAEFASNWELSTARAVNVVHYLAETVGVDPTRLAAAGYSQFHPRSRDKRKNRRIEILLTPLVEVKKGK